MQSLSYLPRKLETFIVLRSISAISRKSQSLALLLTLRIGLAAESQGFQSFSDK
jgi:hypothetical protein